VSQRANLSVLSFKSPHTIIGKSQYRVFAHQLLAFLTNIIYGIRWINKFVYCGRDRMYGLSIYGAFEILKNRCAKITREIKELVLKKTWRIRRLRPPGQKETFER
jgi:hypothetical protein